MIDIKEARISSKVANENKKLHRILKVADFETCCLSRFSYLNLESKIDSSILYRSNRGSTDFCIDIYTTYESSDLMIVIDQYRVKVNIEDLLDKYMKLEGSNVFNVNLLLKGKERICNEAFDYIFGTVLHPYREAGYCIRKFDYTQSDYLCGILVSWKG